jgi:dTDP-4-dehydrorhamnose reductase
MIGKKKILIFGENGQVSRELQKACISLGEIVVVGSKDANFCESDRLREVLLREMPDVIINAAAYTAVDKAESEPELAMQVNGVAVGAIARAAKDIGALLVHYSTDYVFDGQKETPYVESDEVCPINVYGKTKRCGEEEIISSGCAYFIFRISWIYSEEDSSFSSKMLNLGQKNEVLRVVSDQIGAPTWARTVAEVTAQILMQPKAYQKENQGVFHLCAAGVGSWHEFAREILKDLAVEVVPIPSAEYPTPAQRPKNSQLCCGKIKEVFAIDLPDWREAYRQMRCGG